MTRALPWASAGQIQAWKPFISQQFRRRKWAVRLPPHTNFTAVQGHLPAQQLLSDQLWTNWEQESRVPQLNALGARRYTSV